jgi:hypothetical protein
MTKSLLLSILTVNKNDEYHINQLQRTKFILNYFKYSLKKMHASNKVEYLIVDWGSKEPLSNYFYKEIADCPAIKFINIPNEETKKFKLSLDYSKGLNIGIENSLGKHIMLTSSDQFFPLSVFKNLISLLEKPKIFGIAGNEFKLVPRKQLQDDFFIYEDNMELVDFYFQTLRHSAFSYDIQMNDGSGGGGLLLKKKQYLDINGIKDTDKHNRGQDLVIFHEITQFYQHLDTSAFGSYLLKLPRTDGLRKKKMSYIKNPLDSLKFERDKNIINYKNIEIISNINLPKKKLDLDLRLSFVYNERITIKEIIKTIIECSVFTVFSKIVLKSQDIKFILKMKIVIKIHKLKNIIFDEAQSRRFILCLAKCFPDMTFFSFIDPKENNPLDLLKFRNAIICETNRVQHYGYIKIINFAYGKLEELNKSQNFCVIHDHSSHMSDLSFFKKIINQIKINTTRVVEDNIKTVRYNIEGKLDFNKINLKISTSDAFINFLIYIVKVFFKVKRFFGNIKRYLKR